MAALMAAACGDEAAESPASRGYGLGSADMAAQQQAAAYAAALREAFNLEPSLVLLADPLALPRDREAAPSERLADDVLAALRATGTIQGTCEPADREVRVPVCDANQAGYVIRFSEPFEVAPDTVQLFLTAGTFRPSRDTMVYQPPFQLEQRYTMARRGNAWTVASKARLTD